MPTKYPQLSVSCAAGALSAAMGLLVLAGWALGISVIKSVLPGAVEMKANTAAGLLLAGVALVLLSAQSTGRQRSWAQALGLMVALLGAATSAEYVFDWRLGIDEFLFRDTAHAFNAIRGRMSPYSAVTFTVIGLGLAALPLRAFRWLVRLAGGFGIVIGGASFLGYAWRASEIVTDHLAPPVAINTAVAFFVLGIGMLAASRTRAPAGGLGAHASVAGKALAGFLTTILLLMLAGGYTYRAVANAASSAQWVAHTQQVRGELGRLYADISDAEAGQRNYILSGNPTYLEDYRRHAANTVRKAEALARLVADNQAQLERLGKLRVIIDDRLAALERNRAVFEQSGLAGALAHIASGEGRRLMQAIRTAVTAMDFVEAELLSARENEAVQGRAQVLAALFLTLAFAVIGFALLFRAIQVDIGRRKLAEDALRASEENLAVTLQSIGDGVLVTDDAGRVARLNAVAEQLTGWPQAAAAGRPATEIFHIVNEETREPAFFPVIDTLATGAIHGLANHTLLIARDGSERPIADSCAPIRNREGRVTGAVLVFRDVSIEKAAEARLRQSRAVFANLFESLPGLYLVLSPDLKITAVSDAYLQASMTRREDILGRGLFEVFPDNPDDPAATGVSNLRRSLDRVIRDEVTDTMAIQKYDVRRPDGVFEERYWSPVNSPVFGADRKLEYIIHRVEDVTEFVRQKNGAAGGGSDSEVRARLEQMEATIFHNSQELESTNRQLHAANAELARASRLKDEFLANMSHELRTPLNAILGLSEALLEQINGTLTPRQIKSITTISTSGAHLLALINDILDLSKVEAGKLELHLETLDVDGFCEDCIVFVRTQAMQKKITVTLEQDGSGTKFAADPKRFKQVLVNLLTNAVKFTPDGGQIGLKVDGAEDRNAVRFTVWDTGIGIAGEDQSRLFRAFTQIDSGLTRAQDGTGLGLALVAKLVELHGGGVALESEPGKGSRFIVMLPRIGAPRWEPAMKDLVDRREYRRALVVEDDPTAGEQLVRYLVELGLSCAIHARSHEIFEAMGRERPDLILLDIQLPDESGWVLLAKLKENPATRDIPVVVISVVDEPQKSRALGAAAHFTKPITRTLLAGFLQRPAAKVSQSLTPFVVQPPGHGPLILLAEDNEANIETIGGYLRDKGYAMHYATNGFVAVKLAQELHPALILMDIQMPIMDGLTAIRRIRTDAAFKDTPIVALTALAMPGDRERCIAAGATDYMSKPVSLKALAALVRHLLPVHDPSDETNPPPPP